MTGLIVTAVVIIAAILLYRFHAPVLATLRRFDARNIARRRDELLDRRDSFAHFRHTLRLAEEQVEGIGEVRVPDERTGIYVVRYLFEGERFASREEAEAARQSRIAAKARQFYEELPAALANRRKETLH